MHDHSNLSRRSAIDAPRAVIGRGWRRVLTLPAGTRWMLAVGSYLLALAAWLEFAAPAHPLPFLLTPVAVGSLLCGLIPGAAVTAGGALAIWLFLADPGATPTLSSPAVAVVLVFLASAVALLAAGGAVRAALAD